MEQKSTKKTYLYLARRDKKSVKILTVFPFKGRDDFPPTRITDIKSLGLPEAISKGLEHTIYTERMMWEPFLECAESYESLSKLLQARGYENIPMHFSPSNPIVGYRDGNKEVQYPQLNLHMPKQKTMLRKKRTTL